ncbi:mastermind-like protein 2 [Carettochelys insculpta]|uniref:mastermind-like protein 2 n=1 Tax=Carettochelys insculpta TaxID=44489 RepID=UPI003EBA7116
MGDTAPPQAPDLGAGLLGGGSVGPRVHSAIVERLRARIAVCRQHHQSCEGRYERGRAESSDRERESTLQLLSLVQHGQGARKSGKHSKAAGGAGPAPPAAPPDYHPQLLSNGAAGGSSGINGDQPPAGSASEGGQRHSALIALQGSLKRKLVVNLSPANNKRPNGVSDNSFLDIKRIRAEDNLSMGQGGHINNCQNQSMSGLLSGGQGSQRKSSNLTNSAHSSGHMFNMPLKEVKKEPGETISCSKHLDDQLSHENVFPNRYGEDTGEQMMDPELQELFNELTNISVPPMSDLELENMINATIKQDEPFNIDLGQQNQRGTARSSLPMEKIVIKSEYSPGLNQAPVGSPQMRPSSTGPAFTMSSTAMSTSSPIPSVPQNQAQSSQVSSVSNRPLTNWQEVSHAQQLKQIAANRQQHALIQQQQQQQQQQNQPASWPTLSPSGPSPGQFGQEKIPSPSFRQQQFSPQSSTMSGVPVNGNQSKAMSNYIYKSNSTTQSNPIDIIIQPKPQDLNRNFINNTPSPIEQHHGNTKPLCHFNSEQTNQPMPSVLGSQSKPSILHFPQQPQNPGAVQAQQQQATQPLQNQPLQRPPNVPLALQQKMLLQKMQQSPQISGLQYPVSQQHRQDQQHSVVGQGAGPSPNSSPCSNPNSGSGYVTSPQQSMLNQQLMEKKQALQRQMMEQKQQLLLQQQMMAEAEKIAPQDQLNRHLIRPPPDYKDQRRNVVSMQQANQYSGGSPAVSMSSNQSLSNPISTHSIMSQNSSLLTTPHGSRMPCISAARNIGCYGNISSNQSSSYNMTSGMNQMHHRNQNQIITSQNNPMMSRQSILTQGNNITAFGTGSVVNPQQVRTGLNHGTTGIPAQRPSNVMITSSAVAQNWPPPEAATKQQDALKPTGVRFPTSTPYPNQSLQRSIGNTQFPQRAMAPPNQLATSGQMRPPLNQMNQPVNGQPVGSLRGVSVGPNQIRAQTVPNLNHPGTSMTPPSSLHSTNFTSTNQNSRAYQGTDHGNDLAFDFLNQQGDNIGPALNSDSDFIESLLKTEPGNDDWMKDINLDEILGSHS